LQGLLLHLLLVQVLPVRSTARAAVDVNSLVASDHSYKKQHPDRPMQQQQQQHLAAPAAAAGHQLCHGSLPALSMVGCWMARNAIIHISHGLLRFHCKAVALYGKQHSSIHTSSSNLSA
jgi:hypothetical protein